MNTYMFLHLASINAMVSVLVGILLGALAGGGTRGITFVGFIAFLVWVASSLVMLLWYRFRHEARWNYLEGLAWGLLVFVLALVPFLWIVIGQNGFWNMNLLGWFGLALLISSPVLLAIAPFVPLQWKRALDGIR